MYFKQIISNGSHIHTNAGSAFAIGTIEHRNSLIRLIVLFPWDLSPNNCLV